MDKELKSYPITNKKIEKMIETLEFIVADPKTRRIMQEEHWAAMNEILWEKQAIAQSNQIAALNNENTALSNENEELRRLLKQSGIDIPFD